MSQTPRQKREEYLTHLMGEIGELPTGLLASCDDLEEDTSENVQAAYDAADIQVRSILEEIIRLHHNAADLMHQQGAYQKHATLCMTANKFAGMLKAAGGYVPRDWKRR